MIPNFKVGDWLVEPALNRIVKDREIREIEPRHMRVLVCLLSHPGKQITVSKLLQEAYRNKRANEESLHIAVRHLREALEDTGERPRIIQAEPGKGYTLIAKVRTVETQTTPTKSRGFTWKLVAAAIVVALIVFMLQRKQAASETKAVEQPIQTIMMLPLESISKSEAASQLTQVVDVALRNRLAGLIGLRVVAPPEGEPRAALDQLTVDAIVTGSVTIAERVIEQGTSNRRISLEATVTRLKPRRVLWTRKIDGSLEQVIEMQAQLSDELVDFLSSSPAQHAGDSSNVRPEAFQAFAEGHALLSRQRYQAAAEQFQHALELEPNYAEPYLGLALAKTKLAQTDPLLLHKELNQLVELLRKAIELKPDMAEAYSALGNLQFLYTWDFAAAEKNLRKALELNPNDVEPHHWYAMFSLAFGRFDATREHLEQIHRLAPFSYSQTEVAWMYNMMGDYANAERELEALAKRDPKSLALHSARLRLYENMNEERKAFSEYLTLFQARGYKAKELEEVRQLFSDSGLSGVNHWLAHTKFEQRDVGQYEPPLSIARYLSAINDKRLALDWLEKAAELKQPQLLWLNVDPKYDALRSDPRFSALVAKIGLDYRSSYDEQNP